MEEKMYGIDMKKLSEFKQLMRARKKMDFGATVSVSLYYGPHIPEKVPKKANLTFVSVGAKLNIKYIDSIEEHSISLKNMWATQQQNTRIVIEFKDADLKFVEIYFKDEETTQKFVKLMPPIARPMPSFESLDYSESSSDGSIGRGGTQRSSSEDDYQISGEEFD